MASGCRLAACCCRLLPDIEGCFPRLDNNLDSVGWRSRGFTDELWNGTHIKLDIKRSLENGAAIGVAVSVVLWWSTFRASVFLGLRLARVALFGD